MRERHGDLEREAARSGRARLARRHRRDPGVGRRAWSLVEATVARIARLRGSLDPDRTPGASCGLSGPFPLVGVAGWEAPDPGEAVLRPMRREPG
jgi:hypothetical protein